MSNIYYALSVGENVEWTGVTVGDEITIYFNRSGTITDNAIYLDTPCGHGSERTATSFCFRANQSFVIESMNDIVFTNPITVNLQGTDGAIHTETNLKPLEKMTIRVQTSNTQFKLRVK